MKKLFCLFILSLLPIFISAQNTAADSMKLKADLSITGFWQGGNVQTWIFRAQSQVVYEPWEKWEFKTRNSYVYQAFGGDKADEDILSLNFLSYNTEARVYPLVLGFVSTNFRREIDLRYLVGAGSTIKVITSKNAKLTFSLTSEFEETFYASDQFNRSEFNNDDTITTMRGTFWVNGRYTFLDKHLILTHESFMQQSLANANNYRWQTSVGLELPVSKYVNFKIDFLETYESIVVDNQLRGDELLSFGLTVKNF